MDFDFGAVLAYWPELLNGAMNSLIIIALSGTLGYFLGIALSVLYWAGNRFLRAIVTIYVELFRTTPALLQLMYVYLVLPSVIGVDFGPMTAAWITIGMNTAAFFSEILKAGFQSVDKTQFSAAIVLRLSKFDTLRYVVFPQVIRNVFPPTAALFVTIIKYSSLAAGIGALELTRVGQLVAIDSFRLVEILTVVAIVYFIIAYPFAVLSRAYEAKLRKGMY